MHQTLHFTHQIDCEATQPAIKDRALRERGSPVSPTVAT